MQQKVLFYFIVLILFSLSIHAQQNQGKAPEKCASMTALELKFAREPQLKVKFEQARIQFKKTVKDRALRSAADSSGGNRTTYSIPIVFHIVLTNPDVVTDKQIQAQLDTLNKDFSGSNGDSTKIPSFFKPLFGKSGIQFCLAQQTPDAQVTSGIERIKTTKTLFDAQSEDVKHASRGGADSWDNTAYYNVWITSLSGGILGYATFPEMSVPEEQGVEIDYRSLPGGSLTAYNGGKTLTHETGHYFNLFHVWGDDGGACTGSDDVDDTPNQADATNTCYSGIKTDACTPDGNGIMYENYMDYSFDPCLVMFTTDQVERMESALIAYRSSLLQSKACTPPIIRNYDARLSSVDQPSQRLCSGSFTPAVTIKNRGSQVLTSLKISSRIDNGSISDYNWSGSLSFLAATSVLLNNLTVAPGIHTLTIYVSDPDNKADEDVTNDTLSETIQFYNPVAAVSESFEGDVFPPTAWDIVNPDYNMTWKRVTGTAKTGNASVMMENFNYNAVGENDDLRMPGITLQGVDSAFLSFQVAAAVYTDPSTANNTWDTLQVLASTDCGQTYTSLYKKYGGSLITRQAATTTFFTPTTTEWRKDSINLSNYVGQGNVLLTFRNTNGYENNIYLDDINMRTVTINPNLKREGFLVTPNPTSGAVTVQFYPQPANLRALQVYTITGQKIYEMNIATGQANNYYRFNISRYASGTYIVRAVFTDKVITKKIMKL